jgi:hypothetical protein
MTTRTHNGNKYRIPTGYIIYRGPSLLDGKPIVVVAITKESKNAKTGNMVQTYILADNGKSPVESAHLLEDVSVCGDCKHRRGLGGSCYVNLGQGARSVMDGVMRGIYPSGRVADVGRLIRGRKVRLGTYGDPMAVPAHVWLDLVEYAAGHTGYTHQWIPESDIVKSLLVMHPDQYETIRALCMASVDNEDEWWYATYNNWRTFRVRGLGDAEVNDKEFVCPASEEAGKKKQCHECMACNGVGEDDVRSKKATVVITVHGSLKSRFEARV